MKSTPARPETIMLLTALPPAPPTPHTMIRGFSSRNSGAFKLIVILGLLTLDARRRRLNHDISSYKDTFPGSDATPLDAPADLETFLQPPTDPRDIAIFADAGGEALAARFEMLDARHLRIDHQTHRRGKSRALG